MRGSFRDTGSVITLKYGISLKRYGIKDRRRRLMDKMIEDMYKDAMVAEDLQDFLIQEALTNDLKMREVWERASAGIERIIKDTGSISMEAAEELLAEWRTTRELGNDFRAMAGHIRFRLLPLLSSVLGMLHRAVTTVSGAWEIRSTSLGYFTIRDVKSGRYLHDPYDPMREAGILAERIYSIEMDSFHILGCGLGYLPYQVWKRSEGSVRLYLYEEDMSMIRLAQEIGVLSMIPDDNLIIVDNKDVEEMLKIFVYSRHEGIKDHYVSDWKAKEFFDHPIGKMIAGIDFDDRTERTHDVLQKANRRKNSARGAKPIDEFKKDYDLEGKECVIISAGPSLNDNIDFLRESVGKRVLIATNAVLYRLKDEDIIPDVVVMLDPLPSLVRHINGVEEYYSRIPLVALDSGSSTFIEKYRGEVYLLSDEKGTCCANFGGTVSSMGLYLAYYLHAKAVHLIGNDLAFSEGVNYAEGLVHEVTEGMEADSLTGLLVDSVDGGKVPTDYLYNTYRLIFEEQIREHPDVKVYNRSKHGARIAGTIEKEETT